MTFIAFINAQSPGMEPQKQCIPFLDADFLSLRIKAAFLACQDVILHVIGQNDRSWSRLTVNDMNARGTQKNRKQQNEDCDA